MNKSHWLVVVLIVLLASLGLYHAINYGIANLAHTRVLNTLKQWQTVPNEHSYAQFSDVKTQAQQAVLNHPDYAEYWSVLAQVHEWGFIFGYEDNISGLLEAEKHYLRATELRPLWPDTWASLIKLKWRRQEFDQQLLYYFKQATRLGPQKPDIHVVVVELGLALHASSHPFLQAIRADFYHRLALGLKHPASKKRVLELLSQYQVRALTCDWLNNVDHKTRKTLLKCQ